MGQGWRSGDLWQEEACEEELREEQSQGGVHITSILRVQLDSTRLNADASTNWNCKRFCTYFKCKRAWSSYNSLQILALRYFVKAAMYTVLCSLFSWLLNFWKFLRDLFLFIWFYIDASGKKMSAGGEKDWLVTTVLFRACRVSSLYSLRVLWFCCFKASLCILNACHK